MSLRTLSLQLMVSEVTVVSFDISSRMDLPMLIVNGVEHMPDARYYTEMRCTCGSCYPCADVRKYDPRGFEFVK